MHPMISSCLKCCPIMISMYLLLLILDQLEEHVTYLVCEVELNKKKIYIYIYLVCWFLIISIILMPKHSHQQMFYTSTIQAVNFIQPHYFCICHIYIYIYVYIYISLITIIIYCNYHYINTCSTGRTYFCKMWIE